MCGRGGAADGPKSPELYRITYDGSIADEPHFVAMGGATDPIPARLESFVENATLPTRSGWRVGRCGEPPAPVVTLPPRRATCARSRDA